MYSIRDSSYLIYNVLVTCVRAKDVRAAIKNVNEEQLYYIMALLCESNVKCSDSMFTLDVAKLIYEKGMKPKSIAIDGYDNMIMSAAAEGNNVPAVNWLISCGAKLFNKAALAANWGNEPLFVAISNDNYEIVDIYLAHTKRRTNTFFSELIHHTIVHDAVKCFGAIMQDSTIPDVDALVAIMVMFNAANCLKAVMDAHRIPRIHEHVNKAATLVDNDTFIDSRGSALNTLIIYGSMNNHDRAIYMRSYDVERS